ncbi:MAG TPA: GNAT family N-acetyltransferase [Syntrophus sp. (in: bacteria)]|jgi:ribosomal protein S18 acetylase RimI-like enzyme|nr:GNAT family N-acetyltransferase [Syntrophus sp. (in: bacteria)]
MNFEIRPCLEADAGILAETIRVAFRDVAERFGLTRENAPRHPSNCSPDWIEKDMARGVVYYMLEDGGRASGCVALEMANAEVGYLERLAVLPERRRRGFGRALVAHALSEAARRGARRVNIGMIAEQAELKDWYRGLGFVEGETREFAHLPFRVTFLSQGIQGEEP